MLRYTIPILLITCRFFTPEALPARQGMIENIRFADFERFRRVEIFTGTAPEYSIIDSTEVGALYLQFAMAASSAIRPVRDSSGVVIMAPNAQGTMVKIALPYRFRYDAFYFAPSGKLIIDCYRTGELSEQRRQSVLEKAVFALQRGDTLQALALYEQEARSNPDNTRVYLQMGMLYFLRDETERARASLEKIRQDPELGVVAEGLLQRMLTAGQQNEGEEQLSGGQEESVVAEASEPEPQTDQPPGENAEAAVEREPQEAVAQAEQKTAPEPIIVAVRPKKSLLASIEEYVPFPALLAIVAVPVLFFAVLLFILLRRRRLKTLIGPRKTQYNRIMNLMQANTTYQQQKQKRREAVVPPRKSDLDRLEENLLRKQRRRMPAASAAGKPSPEPGVREQVETRRTEFKQALAQYMDRETPAPALKQDRNAQKEQIHSLAAEGLTVRQIAEQLNVSIGEVELVLGFSKLDGAEEPPKDSDLRMDFAF